MLHAVLFLPSHKPVQAQTNHYYQSQHLTATVSCLGLTALSCILQCVLYMCTVCQILGRNICCTEDVYTNCLLLMLFIKIMFIHKLNRRWLYLYHLVNMICQRKIIDSPWYYLMLWWEENQVRKRVFQIYLSFFIKNTNMTDNYKKYPSNNNS